jgi:hypothetical protein
MMLRISTIWIVLLVGSVLGSAFGSNFSSTSDREPPPGCKPVQHFGVSGCEIGPDQTCPPGYHKQVVDPPDPRMKAPSFIMCVADKPQPKEKEQPPATPPKGNR